MRIVLSNASLSWGGVHRVTDIVTRGLIERGHDVTIFGRPGSMLEERMRSIAPFDGVLGATDFGPVSIWRSARALRRHRAEVVMALMKKDARLTLVAARALGIPAVMRHSYEQPLPKGLRGRAIYGGSIMHVANAEATRRRILDSAPWLAESKVEVIYNGIDAAPYLSALPITTDIPENAVRFGLVANLTRRKGTVELARAWRRVVEAVPNAHLLIAGKGSGEEQFREMLSGVPRVHWLGYRRDVPNVIRSFDVLVLPSHLEGAPNVVLEAMASRVAIVATAVSGTPELVRDGIEARLIPPRNDAALADAMIELARNESLRRTFADSGHARVLSEFALARMIDRYEDMLLRAANVRPSAIAR
jgi:glycosyltransferase involved in cell wall biosynthesis